MTHTCGGQQRRVGLGAETTDVGLELGDLSVESPVTAGEVPQCLLRERDCGLRLAGTPTDTHPDPGSETETSELVFHHLRSGNSQRMDLVGGLDAGLGSGTASHHKNQG